MFFTYIDSHRSIPLNDLDSLSNCDVMVILQKDTFQPLNNIAELDIQFADLGAGVLLFDNLASVPDFALLLSPQSVSHSQLFSNSVGAT